MASYFGRGEGPVAMSDIRCSHNVSDVRDCAVDWNGGVNCDHSRDAGVICDFNSAKILIGGSSSSEGTIEFKHGLGRYTYCDDDFDNNDGGAICRELGFWNPAPVVYNSSHFGVGSSPYKIRPDCTGSEGNIEMCRLKTRFHTETCGVYHTSGVDCNPTDISLSAVRLVDGPGPGNGRLELRSNGGWGSVCYDSWEPAYANVVCQTLRYSADNANVTSYPIPHGLTSMFAGSLMCNDTVRNLGQCLMDYDISNCSKTRAHAVGIDCSGGFSVSLSYPGNLSGQVFIHTGNGKKWSVCANGLTTNAAAALCSMAGFRRTRPNISTVMSQVPVLFRDISCDGWESHVLQCSTINGSTGCDDKAAVDCFNGCVHYFEGTSGTLTSPRYPGYPGDSDCLYVIRNAAGQPTKLDFTDLDLASDGDFVEVTDGIGGRQLGYYEDSATPPYLVSDKPIYIRFHSNANGQARGFRACYSPLKIEDTVKLGCGHSSWNVAVNTTMLRLLYPDTGVSQIKLTNQLCTGKVMGDLVVFNQRYTECASTSKTNADNVVYYNQLVYPESNIPFPIIVHGYRWKVEVECDVSRTDTLSSNFHPNQSVISQAPHVTGSAHYQSEVKFFTDSTFYKEITGNPVVLKTGEDVFVLVRMNSDDIHVKMRIDTCYAKPDPNAGADLTYMLINNGCVVDPYTQILSQGTHETKFVFNAFEFPQAHDSVYIYCTTTFCQTNDASRRCSQTCVGTPSIVG